MKEILGSIAAAALLGIGCAHGQKGQARAEVPDPQDTSPIAQQAQAGGMMSSQGSPALSCTVVRPGASTTQRSQSLQEDSGTGGSAASECVPSETDPDPSLGQSSTGSSTDMGVGGAGNAEVDDNPAPMQPGQPSIGSSIQQDSAIIPPATRSERDVAPPDILSEDMPADELGTGGSGSTGVGINAAPAPSGLDAIGNTLPEESAPADTQMAPASESAEDLGTGGAGNTDADVNVAPAPAGQDTGNGAAPQDLAPADTQAAPASEPAPVDSQFQDTGMGGAGGGGG